MSSFLTRSLALSLEERARRTIAGQVRALFNDRTRGEQPVVRSDDSAFEPGSPIWRVHGDVASMMIGGIAALLLQMLHPSVLAGVWDHSKFRTDMLGRLRRTARFIAITTYGASADAAAAIARVREVHDVVAGTLPDGTSYRATDPELLSWVHVTEATCFLAAWQRYGGVPLTPDEQDRYFAQFATIARQLGASPVPNSVMEAERLIEDMRPRLQATARSREVSRLVLQHRPENPLAIPIQAMTAQAAVDLLPGWARRMHGFPHRHVAGRLADVGTHTLGRTLRWTFQRT